MSVCLELIVPFLQSVQFNTNVMHQNANSGYLDATALLESLVMQRVPFRDAHHQVGLWFKEIFRYAKPIQEEMQATIKKLFDS